MKSIRNFRDIGNKNTKFGIIKEKKLLRGGPLNHITKDEIDILKNEYNLKKVIDFRNVEEIENETNIKIDGIEYINIEVIDDTNQSANPEEMMEDLAYKNTSDFMYVIYKDFITSKKSHLAYKRFIEELAKTEDGAVYFHCTAGKDRTGFAAMLVLSLLGSNKFFIYEDYLETNNNVEKHKEELIEAFKVYHDMDSIKDEMILDILGVRKEYLDTTYDTIKEIYGEFEIFVKDALKIDENIINQLRRIYLK